MSPLKLDIDKFIWLFVWIIAMKYYRIRSQGYSGDIWRAMWADVSLLGYVVAFGRIWHFIHVQGADLISTNSIFN